MKDYNTRKAINVPENESVRMVNMGSCEIINSNEKIHLLTYGLGPCVGVSVVIKSKDGMISRLLAHIDMGQIIGVSIKGLSDYFKKMKNNISGEIESIEISLSSTQSFRNVSSLNDNETKLLAVILREFQKYGISVENINIDYSSQVQISPEGVISNYSEYELEQHRQYMMESALKEYDGYVHPDLDIYITKFGAYMSDISTLELDCSDEEKTKELEGSYWQKYINKGYNLVIAPSFNNPQYQAVYVSNWQENVSEYGTVIGCLQANHKKSEFRSFF